MCRILPQIKDERVAVHNLHIPSNMDSREGIVPGDHDALYHGVSTEYPEQTQANSPDATN